MTEDDKLAEEYANTVKCEWENDTYYVDCRDEVEEAFLAGLKAARQEKWHDLRKNPKDLPAENQEVLIYFTLPDKSRNDITLAEFENNDFNFVDLQDVIAWCEIPTFKE